MYQYLQIPSRRIGAEALMKAKNINYTYISPEDYTDDIKSSIVFLGREYGLLKCTTYKIDADGESLLKEIEERIKNHTLPHYEKRENNNGEVTEYIAFYPDIADKSRRELIAVQD